MKIEKPIPDTLDYLTEIIEVEGERKPRWEVEHFIFTRDVIESAMRKFYRGAAAAYPNHSKKVIERIGDNRILDLVLTPTERGTTLMAHVPAYECGYLLESLKGSKSVKKLLMASIQLPADEGGKKAMAFARFLCKTGALKRLGNEQDVMDVLTAAYYPEDAKKSAAAIHIGEQELPVLFEMLSAQGLKKLAEIKVDAAGDKSMKDILVEAIGNYAKRLTKDADQIDQQALPYAQAAKIFSERAHKTREQAANFAAKLAQVNTR